MKIKNMALCSLFAALQLCVCLSTTGQIAKAVLDASFGKTIHGNVVTGEIW